MKAGAGAVLALALLALSAPARADGGPVARGEYVFRAAGCEGCHTDAKRKGPALAGGRALKTPFGTFYGPNITPDPVHGIGGWSAADFVRAMRDGVAPDGSHYYPAFPYTSFTRMSDRDLADLWAYLSSVPPAARPSRPHEVQLPFSWRFLLTFWKWLNFAPGPLRPDATRPPEWNRGAYLVEALGHCGECHTPRDRLGGLDRARAYAGAGDGPEGESVPNITPDAETGIGDWQADDVVLLLKTGIMLDGDVVGSLMAEVVEHSTSRLGDGDLQAIALYLRSLAPIRNRIGAPAR